jgi:hypothetical protein
VEKPIFGEKIRALEVVVDAEKSRDFFQSEPSLFETKTGVRCRVLERGQALWKQHERQAHTDQLLAVFAELRIPLSHPIRTVSGKRTVRELLVDALANFALDQKEIEWSALAFILYLPPQRSWADKFGRSCDFDALAEELLSCGMEGRSCGGSHILFALTAMLQIDRRTSILTDKSQKRIRDHLRQMVGYAVRNQSSAGFWRSDWHRSEKNLDLENGRRGAIGPSEVLITGHQLEWMMFLPPELSPPRDCFLRGANWLQSQLLTATPSTIKDNYCPYSHAGRVLMLLSGNSERY